MLLTSKCCATLKARVCVTHALVLQHIIFLYFCYYGRIDYYTQANTPHVIIVRHELKNFRDICCYHRNWPATRRWTYVAVNSGGTTTLMSWFQLPAIVSLLCYFTLHVCSQISWTSFLNARHAQFLKRAVLWTYLTARHNGVAIKSCAITADPPYCNYPNQEFASNYIQFKRSTQKTYQTLPF